ncbi:hypothetical protein B0H15DRAFT_787000 [Mycena belliarum]|uniref:Fe2OG dioxygenase domain-containing protein n=1 Tax=Mycena belliarum TaxID=1033014 RepID=A0AAD6TVC5_9AGAR|nr:hypothetical protein B0H15DRAFT_787000 [Mycena belliae]
MEIKERPFTLKITRKGCEYDGKINALESDVAARLERWYAAGDVSGYGDVRAQETKVDLAVRNAREIPASDFSVSADLIEEVERLWGASFVPTHVRAEPYKIHMYGPGGKFNAHRDTPEMNLVGTFLIGLGDTSRTKDDKEDDSSLKGAFKVGARHYFAHLGSWVAFYPDIGHAVEELVSGYRAVIAFNIFRQELPEAPKIVDDSIIGDIKAILAPLEKPYGILLHHEYCAGTTELTGGDAALYAAVCGPGVDVKLLPVLINWKAQWDPDSKEIQNGTYYDPCVFPMTAIHADTVLERIKNHGSDTEVHLEGTDAEWINDYQTEEAELIPFYSPRVKDTVVQVWPEEVEVEYTGSGSRPHEEEGIYLSYAIVALPISKGVKRVASEDLSEGDTVSLPAKERKEMV